MLLWKGKNKPLAYESTSQVPMALSVRAASNLFISVVGAGVLGLPYAFRRSGLIQGTLVMIIIAALNLHCMLLLVKLQAPTLLFHLL